MVHLPQELMIEILLRLPVKSLIRFRCVCKSWLSIISDSQFSVSHFELAATHTERLMFFEPSTPKIGSIDFHASFYDDSAFAVLRLNFLPTKPYNLRIRGSCRGFVVLDCCRSLWMWNPSTGVRKQLPDSPIVSSRDDIFLTFLYGFGYDPSTNDYLMLKLSYKPFSSHIANRVHIFSLRANMWTEIEGTRLFYMNSANDVKVGSLFNGALHWLVYRCNISKNVILAFDLTKRTFSEIPLPVEFELDFNNFDLVVLGKFPSSLCVVRCCPSAEIWVMKEYKVQSSWTKTIVVAIDDIPTQYFSPICSTNCSDIVGIDGNTGLAKCNDKGMLQEHRYYSPYRSDELSVGKDSREFLITLLEEGRSCFGPNQLEVAVYTESLLQLSYEL